MRKRVDNLFLRNQVSKRIETREHLEAFLADLFADESPWTPPGRNEGRTATHRERYSLRYFLAQERGNFVFPMSIYKMESPDFVILEKGERSIGVEHTDAGPEEYQRWLGQTGLQDGTFMVLEREKELGAAAATLAGPERPYLEASLDVTKAVLKKLDVINKPGFKRTDKLVLVVYVLSNMSLKTRKDLNRVFKHLRPRADVVKDAQIKNDQGYRFDRVLVVLGDHARYWTA